MDEISPKPQCSLTVTVVGVVLGMELCVSVSKGDGITAVKDHTTKCGIIFDAPLIAYCGSMYKI